MANAQRVAKGYLRAIYVNETSNKDAIAKQAVYVNQTITTTTVSHKLLTTMGIG